MSEDAFEEIREAASRQLAAENVERLSRELNWVAHVAGLAARHHYNAMVEPLDGVVVVPDAIAMYLLQSAAGSAWNAVLQELRGQAGNG